MQVFEFICFPTTMSYVHTLLRLYRFHIILIFIKLLRINKTFSFLRNFSLSSFLEIPLFSLNFENTTYNIPRKSSPNSFVLNCSFFIISCILHQTIEPSYELTDSPNFLPKIQDLSIKSSRFAIILPNPNIFLTNFPFFHRISHRQNPNHSISSSFQPCSSSNRSWQTNPTLISQRTPITLTTFIQLKTQP